MQGAKFNNASDALRFILAGKAIFTLRSTKTGKRYTYKVEQPEDKKGESFWFCGYLTGPDNYADYNYLCVINAKGIYLTKKSRLNRDSEPVKAIEWTINQLRKGILPSTLEVYHEGQCGRCGRKLTVPASILTGFGPECSSLVGIDRVEPMPPSPMPKGGLFDEEEDGTPKQIHPRDLKGTRPRKPMRQDEYDVPFNLDENTSDDSNKTAEVEITQGYAADQRGENWCGVPYNGPLSLSLGADRDEEFKAELEADYAAHKANRRK